MPSNQMTINSNSAGTRATDNSSNESWQLMNEPQNTAKSQPSTSSDNQGSFNVQDILRSVGAPIGNSVYTLA